MTETNFRRIDQVVIDEVRARVSLSGLVAHRVKLRRAGRGLNGLCPFHNEKSPSFTVSDDKGFYHCFGCGAHGDAFRFVQEVDGVDFREAVVRLAADAGVDLPSRPSGPSAALDGRIASATSPIDVERRQVHDVVSSTTAGRWIWQSAGPAAGTIVERYLKSRGLDPLAAFDGEHRAIDGIRFHPRAPVSAWRVQDDPGSGRMTAPAMVVPILGPEGGIRGVEVSWLKPDGSSHADLPPMQGRPRPKRKIFGKIGGCAAMLTPPEAMCGEVPLVVGEGLETTWSFAQDFGKPCRVAAALSLGNLQGGALKLSDGSLPLWNLRANPEQPPFVLAQAGKVVALVDADMKPLTGQKVQDARGARPVRRELTGLERAEICAALTAQHWRRAGADSVTAVRPRMGDDFNDQLRSAA